MRWIHVIAVLFACVFTWAPALAEPAARAPSIVLAQIYRENVDVTQYLVSEKYDGVRAIWDGHELRFRSGNRVNAPEWFTASLPAVPLDGELWLGRGRFAELSGIVRKADPVDAEWRQLRYMLFELPGATGSFGDRAERIDALVTGLNLPWLQSARQFRVADTNALMKQFRQITREGAEGLMLHRADAPYVTGRSDVLLKLKPLQDAEATVIDYVPGRGRYQGLVGALAVRAADGRHFRVGGGLSDADRRHPPPVGSVITYRYQELTSGGIPRFPRYWRLREVF